ncbi:MAG TPA: adenine deaminase [Firmicutes bacterium]|nr:adenine deaminase [Bacillota bacterium]
MDAALGKYPSDLVLKNSKIINVFSGKIIEGNLAIIDGYIVGIGDYVGKEEIDLEGRYISPGFIDSHVHIESSMVELKEFSKAVVPRGTTSVIIDPHEIANVLGLDGIRYMLDSAKFNPLNVFIMLPSCVPATDLETSGAALRAFDLHPLMHEKWVVGLGEMMNFPGVLNKDPVVLDKIAIAMGERIDGHAPGLSGKDLNAYISVGITSDHECTELEEAREKLEKGMYIMIREGTATKNLEALIPLVNDYNISRFMFCTDDRHPNDLLTEGHIDYIIRRAIKFGVDPIKAIRIATLNPSLYFRLEKLGAIAPGYIADLVILNNLRDLDVYKVMKNGKFVSIGNKLTYVPPQYPEHRIRGTVNIKWLEEKDFMIPAETGKKANIIEIVPDQIITRAIRDYPKVENGVIIPDTEKDILLIAVVERHMASENIGLGLVRGFGLKEGAIASSVAHDSHNIIVVGTNFKDILRAVIRVRSRQGGLVFAKNGEVVENLPLPIAGLISNEPLEVVNEKIENLIKAVREAGSPLNSPFMQMSFLALPVIPELKLTDQGLFDVRQFKYIDLFSE